MSNRSTLLLEHHLKELKLPSFLREYGKMAAPDGRPSPNSPPCSCSLPYSHHSSSPLP